MEYRMRVTLNYHSLQSTTYSAIYTIQDVREFNAEDIRMRQTDIFQTPYSLRSISRRKKLDYQLDHYRHCLHWHLPLTNLQVFIPHTENSPQKIHDH